jgi:hypothetical protein
MEGGPWNFRKFLVSTMLYDGFNKSSSIKLDSVAVRAETHDPVEAYRLLPQWQEDLASLSQWRHV